MVINLDTMNLLNIVELEGLSAEELIEIRSSLGVFKTYLQYKKLVIDPKFCNVHIYRVILVTKLNE